MAIQMRRGAYAQFDPSKMKAGEWAVSTDSDTKKQHIWMCFAPGIVKRMGTVEDFDIEIQILIQNYLDGIAESVEKAQESAKLATSKAQESSTSASRAKTSETNAKTSEINASNSAAKARASEVNAKASEAKAKASETSASTSATNAKASETNSKTSETNAKKSETNASASATNAKTSETNAKASATIASTSATNAKASETKAKEYEESAHSTITTINEAAEATRLNKEAAARSEANAKASENQALSYKNSASASEQASKTSETNAKTYADNASSSAASASTSAGEASKSKASASASASQAKTSETNAKTSETNSAKSESEAQKYAEQVKEISESFSGALRPLGTISFVNLPSTADANSGDMYNITDQFITTTDFKEGAGNIIPAGSNVYLTIDRYWDVLAGTPVTGVKGNSESLYRRGNVNITPANIGALSTTGEASNTTVNFTESASRTKPTTGEKISSIVGKIVKFLSDLKTVAFTGSYNDLSNKPLSLPANGGNSTTVNGHTVNADVPSGAKFTDTHVTVTDNLTSTSTANALSANQGRILKNGLDEVNQSLAVKTGTLTQISSYPLYMNYCYRVGNIVEIGFMLNAATSTKTNGTTIFNVPTGFRPLVDSWAIAFHSNGSSGYARLVFSKTGEVRVVNPNGYSINTGSITYVCTQ
nr:MAG TPA: L SHAPED TAIL FIBER PROTEIN [Caudoviricetes sp.]